MLNYLEIFLQYQKAFNSPMTYKHYKETLSYYIKYLQKKKIKLENVGIIDYNDYIIYLRSKNLANRTIITYTRAVKTMYAYLYTNGYIKSDIYTKFRLIRRAKKIKKPLMEEEVNQIDENLDISTYIGYRNYLIIHLMLDNGLRVSEVVRLKVSDITSKYINIYQSKGSKDRIIPISPTLYDKLSNFISKYNIDCYIFNISYQGIKSFIQRLSKSSGVGFYAHLLRHTFATSYIYYGGNISFLSLILGHSTISTTEKYIHLSNSFKLLDDIEIYKIRFDIK